MSFLKKIFDFYIDASIHVALAVYAFVRITMLTFNIAYDENLGYVVFYGAIVGYNFLRYAGDAKHYLFVDKTYVKVIQAFSFIAFFLSCYYIFQLPFEIIYRIVGLVIVAVLYMIPFSKRKRNIRSLAGVKVLVVALVWTATTVLLPVINADVGIGLNVVLEAVQRFIYIIILMIPFEIRDMEEDSLRLKTIPQQFGVKKTKLLGILMLAPFYALEFLKDVVSWDRVFVLTIISLITAVLIFFSIERQGKYYSGFWVESLPILWWLLLLGSKFIFE